MAKLTLIQRAAIVKNILDETFAARRKAIQKRKHALAVKIILAKYGKDAFAKFDAVPVGWLTTANQFLVRYNNRSHYVVLEEARALPSELVVGNMELEEDYPILMREHLALREAQERLSQDSQQLQIEIANTLRAFGTEAALRDGWPEAYSKIAVPRVTHQLPAVRVEDINRRIAALKEAA
jgi:hypothetical protein